jgi:hypothetical protein
MNKTEGILPLAIHLLFFSCIASKLLQAHRYEFPAKCQSDIDRLAAIQTPEHARENEFVKNLRQCKFSVTMCSYAWELLLAFLHEKRHMLLLSIINHHLQIKGTLWLRSV